MGTMHPGSFVLRVAAAFAAATGREALPRRALVSACTGRHVVGDEFQYQRWPFGNGVNRFFMDLVTQRNYSV